MYQGLNGAMGLMRISWSFSKKTHIKIQVMPHNKLEWSALDRIR